MSNAGTRISVTSAISRHKRDWHRLPQKTSTGPSETTSIETKSPLGMRSSQQKFRRVSKQLLKSTCMGALALVLMPLRAAASTVAGPVALEAAETTASTLTHISDTALLGNSLVSAELEMRLIIRIVYAAFMGACLGKERSFAKHSAGVRTMALVAMGASAYTVCSAYGFLAFDKYDPSRMAANVASGVGFVGAGVITTTASDKSQINVVHGLTTAATIWLSAAVGVACGVGLFRIATAAAITTIAILRLGRVKPKVKKAIHAEAKEKKEESKERDEAELHDTSVWDEHHSEHLEHIENIQTHAQELREAEEEEEQDLDIIEVEHDVPLEESEVDDADDDDTDDDDDAAGTPETVMLEIPKHLAKHLTNENYEPEIARAIEAAWRNATITTHLTSPTGELEVMTKFRNQTGSDKEYYQ